MWQDQDGKVPLYWGITADGYVAFADDADLLKGACGKSLASFPQGGWTIYMCLWIQKTVTTYDTNHTIDDLIKINIEVVSN